MAGCSQDDYVGETYDTSVTASGESAILFSSSAPAVTRTTYTGSDGADKLMNSFDVLGTKTVSDAVSSVFADATYNADNGLAGFSDADATNYLYTVWYTDESANTTSTNVAGWEYVGASGTTTTGKYDSGTTTDNTISLNAAQTIKYWDYSASQYDFVAYKATLGGAVTAVTNSGFTFTGTPAELAGLYVADKRVITPTDYGETVTLTFRSSATKVRVGFYETIPGYRITSMTFYYDATSGATSSSAAEANNCYMTGTFLGSSDLYNSSEDKTYPITYVSSTTDNSKSVISDGESSGVSASASYYNFGTLTLDQTDSPSEAEDALSTTITTPTYALLANGTLDGNYQLVTPNTSSYAAMTLKVDYTLTANDGSGETITVTGATATVPAAYMEWKSNYAYTYIFKISQNTNGTTGTPSGDNPDPEGLYPITFDAVVITDEDGTQEVISVGSSNNYTINTYQESSNVTTNAEYTAGTAIYATITDGSTDYLTTDNYSLVTSGSTLSTAKQVAVFSVTGATTSTTEGDIEGKLNGVNNGLTLEAVSDAAVTTFTPSGSSTSANALSFTPTAGTKYAVVYCISPYVVGDMELGNANSATYNAATQYYAQYSTGNTTSGYEYKYYPVSSEVVTSENYGSYYKVTDTGTAPSDGTYAIKYITVKDE